MRRHRLALIWSVMGSLLLLAAGPLLAGGGAGLDQPCWQPPSLQRAWTPVGESQEAPSTAAENAPRIEFQETTFDFGSIYQLEEVKHTFRFRNAGSATLKIEKVQSTCGCTAALPAERQIAAGAEGTIEVTFHSGGMRGRIAKQIHVDTNDPAQPRVTLTITGEVKVEVDVLPRGIYLTTLKLGETVERSVELRPVSVKEFKILGIKASDPAVRVAKPVKLTDKQGGYRLTIRVGPLEKPGRISATVVVRTDLKRSRELTISIYGKVGEKEEPEQAPPSD